MVSGRPRQHYCRCGTHLAKDNTERQCARCQRLSRDKLITSPEVPPEFWETDQFREAFTAQHMGRVARAYRTHPYHYAVYGPGGISQTLLGQWLGLRQSKISEIETGPPIQHLDTLQHWARILQVPPGLLWFRLPEEKGRLATAELAGDDLTLSTSKGERGVPFDPMKRRILMTWGLTTAAATGLSINSYGRVDVADVAQLQRTTDRLHALDQQHGGEALWKAGTTWVNEAHLMLEQGTYSSAVGDQLLSATARLQVCAGWLAFDAGRHEVARSCYTDALALARQAGDPEVEIRAFGLLALRSNILGRPREARRLAIAAGQIRPPSGGSPRLVAIPKLRQAVASSLLAEPHEADHALAEARRGLEHDHDGPIEGWCAFLNSMEIDAVEATCALEVGRPSRAAVLLERAISGYGNDGRYARNRALYRLRLAQARLDMRDVEGAAEAANIAFDDLAYELASWRVNGELDTLAHRLADYPQINGIDHFLVRYDAMSR